MSLIFVLLIVVFCTSQGWRRNTMDMVCQMTMSPQQFWWKVGRAERWWYIWWFDAFPEILYQHQYMTTTSFCINRMIIRMKTKMMMMMEEQRPSTGFDAWCRCRCRTHFLALPIIHNQWTSIQRVNQDLTRLGIPQGAQAGLQRGLTHWQAAPSGTQCSELLSFDLFLLATSSQASSEG